MDFERCNCEHANHFDNEPWDNPTPRTAHIYLEEPIGKYRSEWVGPVCNKCWVECLGRGK